MMGKLACLLGIGGVRVGRWCKGFICLSGCGKASGLFCVGFVGWGRIVNWGLNGCGKRWGRK